MPKFRPVSLDSIVNASSSDSRHWESKTGSAVTKLPTGDQTFWGVPFAFVTSTKNNGNDLVVLADESSVDIAVGAAGSHLVFAHFCDERASTTVAGQSSDYLNPVITAPGEHMADYVVVFTDGSEHRQQIRRRFEINQVQTRMQSGFSSRQHQGLSALPFRGPYPDNAWGRWQTGVMVGDPPDSGRTAARDDREGRSNPPGSWTIYALELPDPSKTVALVRIEATGAAAIAIGAITLFSGQSNPLRHLPLETIELEGPNISGGTTEASVDLGVIARSRNIQSFDGDEWLASPVKGWGEAPDDPEFTASIDLAASTDATLTVNGSDIEVGPLLESGEAASSDGKVKARVLTSQRTWVHGKIIDSSTGEPTAARIHFRSPDGRYFPPYGHTHEVNDNWFEDYGADLLLGDTQYAYIDGTFQGELPVGDVYVEVSKGFEFEPIRQKLNIKPGQRELEITMDRNTDLRVAGWVTADTHTHFLTPETAHLEAAAEGINIINLLAAQWGDLYTNVGDITGAVSGSSSAETIVWVGSENRQHFLGHISLLGATGSPIFPMSTSGPTEGYIGDPTVRAMSEWADEVREKGGLAIVPHFPFPHSEVIAEVVLGRVDGLEIRDFHVPTMDTFAVHEWYRLLSCGYRVPAVGGTDKMSAGMPVGGVRTYAFIGDRELSHQSWSDAVRAGRTYTTSGPLMEFTVEGLHPGDELTLPKSGGSVHVKASASCAMPINKLEIVFNGKVIAQATSEGGEKLLVIDEQLDLPGSGWIAARAVSDHIAWHVWPVHFAAHTSPVYVKAGRTDVFEAALGEYLITTMQGGIEWLDTLATRADAERHANIRRVFTDAIGAVNKKMPHRHENGPLHTH
ncbi:CehA/McbA family metallohydrolase [Dehalococcoides mccartyi]|nr:CehA/McbA family metallohydrolase [Dehalococcoides mccartyi]